MTVTILFLSSRSVGRKNIIEKFPYMVVAKTTLRRIKENCERCFVKLQKQTFTPKQILLEEAIAIRGTVKILDGNNRVGGEMRIRRADEPPNKDAFIQNNGMAQQRLCIDSEEEPEEDLRFVVAFEEGISEANE